MTTRAAELLDAALAADGIDETDDGCVKAEARLREAAAAEPADLLALTS